MNFADFVKGQSHPGQANLEMSAFCWRQKRIMLYNNIVMDHGGIKSGQV